MHFSTNPLDLAAYAVLLVSVAAGIYQGLLATSINTGGFFVSLLSANWFYMGMAMHIKEAQKVIPVLVYYSETSEMLGTVETSRTGVSGMTQLRLENILQNVSMPYPVEKWFSHNVLGAVYTREGLTSLGDYLSHTVAEVAVSIVCFLAILLGVYIAVTIVVNAVHYVVKLPAVRLFDGVLGGAVGLLRGIFLVFALFLVIPAVLSMLPVQQIKDIVDSSQTAAFFYQKNFMFDMIKGYIG